MSLGPTLGQWRDDGGRTLDEVDGLGGVGLHEQVEQVLIHRSKFLGGGPDVWFEGAVELEDQFLGVDERLVGQLDVVRTDGLDGGSEVPAESVEHRQEKFLG